MGHSSEAAQQLPVAFYYTECVDVRICGKVFSIILCEQQQHKRAADEQKSRDLFE
jgi:hypothetical protein